MYVTVACWKVMNCIDFFNIKNTLYKKEITIGYSQICFILSRRKHVSREKHIIFKNGSKQMSPNIKKQNKKCTLPALLRLRRRIDSYYTYNNIK